MSNIFCRILRSNIVLEPNVLCKKKVAIKLLAQTLRSVSYESNEEPKNDIKREENKAPLRFYTDQLLAEKMDKMLRAQKWDKYIKEKRLKSVLKTTKKERPSTNSLQKSDKKDTQMLNYNINRLTNDYPTQNSDAASEDEEKSNTQSNSVSKDTRDHIDLQNMEAEPQIVVSYSRRKVPIRSVNLNSFLQAKIQHAFARGYTNYLTPARYHHMNSTLALREKNSTAVCEMLQKTLMPINKELREKIAVPVLTNAGTPPHKVYNWNHPPPVSKFELIFTGPYNRQSSERSTKKDATHRLKEENLSDEESLPEPMRRWNEYYNRLHKEKCRLDVKDDEPLEISQTERLNALLNLSSKRRVDDAEALSFQFNSLKGVQSRYKHCVDINYCKSQFM